MEAQSKSSDNLASVHQKMSLLCRLRVYIYIYIYMDCQSSWIIYIIECNICKLQYIGKSETAFNLRLNNHRNHIKKGVSSCELTEHFLHNKRTHDFDNNVTITIIKQIRKDHLEADKNKEVLREREIFWQRILNSIQPYGLNKRTE